ncbi:MAG: hypothetical protein MI799_10155 [Desulfobacterales bacterium]|nr:hypothetical protein [Desulfobacterales bacterium]
MNKLKLTAFLAIVALIFTFQVYAASHDDAHGAMDHSAHQHQDEHGDHGFGMKIHTTVQDGYAIEYRLINMKEKMKNMPQIKDTHHLMVFVKDPHGAYVKNAKVGYLIEEKDSGRTQKKMAMAMNQGFGADVTLNPGHHYQIKTKMMAGKKVLINVFKYMGGDH